METVSTQTKNAITVRRTVKVPMMQCEHCVQTIRECLAGLAGMQQVDINLAHKQIRLIYNAAQLGFADIEAALVTAGYPPAHNRWSCIKSAIYSYLDENARVNATSKGGACCSNPSDIYAKRHK